jgi:hypothetical protein
MVNFCSSILHSVYPSCKENSLFSNRWYTIGFLAASVLALFAFTYRKTIYALFSVTPASSPPHTIPPKPAPIPRKFEAIQIPSEVTCTYQGSNAEYIVFKQDGSTLTKQEYLDLAVPILELQFPRNKGTEAKLTPEQLNLLDQDEVAYIDRELDAKGLQAIKIPKTLYDIFYIAFRFETSATALKKGDVCKTTTALERFIWPSASIWRYDANLLVQESNIHEIFIKINEEQVVSKVDAALNNYILSAHPWHPSANPLKWETVTTLVDNLFKRILESMKQNEAILNCMYNGRCPSTECQVNQELLTRHRNHYVFRMVRNFADNQPQLVTVFKKALWLEFSSFSFVYTVYRGGGLATEPEKTAPSLHSASYGHSLCSSCELDMGGAGAIPIEYTRDYGHGYVLAIDKADYRKKGVTGHLFVIPPAQRTARFRLEGEFTHVRTRVHQPGPEETDVHGMQNIAVKKVPYIVTTGNFPNANAFDQELRRYEDRHTRVLTEVMSINSASL